MNVVGVEFDRSKFDTTVACEDYITSNNDLQGLLNLRNFRLKSTISRFISDENRKIWSWYNLWKCENIRLLRPNAYIVILLRVGPEKWDRADIPIPLESTQEKRRKMELLRQKREVNKKEAAEKLKNKRKATASVKKPKKPKKPKKEENLLEDPNPALAALLNEKDNKDNSNGLPMSPIVSDLN